LPDGGELITLRDAANDITKLPKGEHDALAWRAAIEALMLVAEHAFVNKTRRDLVVGRHHRLDRNFEVGKAFQARSEEANDHWLSGGIWRRGAAAALT